MARALRQDIPIHRNNYILQDQQPIPAAAQMHMAAMAQWWERHEVVDRGARLFGKAYMWVRHRETGQLTLLRDRVRDEGIPVG